ncbi:aminoacyl-tRNA hydrolase [Candidatus Peregrinibacteria bacterium]|nr:aminoacyl-tRNA hydrolase [Candidatus Peregrinibacteria bacterium]
MKLIIGLGNIGKEYEKTRHNCGFMLINKLHKKFEDMHIPIEERKENDFKAIIAQFKYNNETIITAKPTTLMNLSGESAYKLVKFYKIKENNLFIAYDDVDLPLGKIRVRQNGSAGTHNGMKSVIEKLGNASFNRIRIGIESRGDTAPKLQDLSSFVLSNFSKKELKTLNNSLEEAAEKILDLLGNFT